MTQTDPVQRLRIASFGFRSFPPRKGSAGADKYALELLPRLAALGHTVTAYNRVYADETVPPPHDFRGVRVVSFRTFRKSGLEALWHSARVTWDIILRNRADVVHMQNGGNSPFAAILRLFGKKTFLSEDGNEWERGKWSWAGKLYLRLTMYISAYIHNQIIFDNVFTREFFEKKFRRSYSFIPFGADVAFDGRSEAILDTLGLKKGEYFLFVGRFIPDKGLHYLVPAFEKLKTDKKLVLVGGSLTPTPYEQQIRATTDPRILCPGYIYGDDVHALMKNCYAYVQPSDLEGLSPVILESSYLGAPVICSDIPANRFGLRDHGLYFRKSDAADLLRVLEKAIQEPEWLAAGGKAESDHVRRTFSWDKVVADHVNIFRGVKIA